MRRILTVVCGLTTVALFAGCSSSGASSATTAATTTTATIASPTATAATPATTPATTIASAQTGSQPPISADASTATTVAAAATVAATGAAATGAAATGAAVTFKAEVWADNWFSLYVNGVKVGEDSVPITTERSFNAETITFTATYPLTVAMVSKDYKETDSGLEYIGTTRQQMGDGGFVAQFTDTSTGKIVAATGAEWKGLDVQRAPLNTDCVTSSNPNVDCLSESLPEPDGWTLPAFVDTAWVPATIYTAAQVGTKDGYDTITWDPSAKLIWTGDLKVDNTILWRDVVTGP